jgi:alkanesulfonate monooxygenase
MGIETFILSGYPHLEEAYRVAELLFPLAGRAQALATDEARASSMVGVILADRRLPGASVGAGTR